MVCGVYRSVWMCVREQPGQEWKGWGGDVEVGKVRRSGYTTGGRTRKIKEKVDGLDGLHQLKKGKERI